MRGMVKVTLFSSEGLELILAAYCLESGRDKREVRQAAITAFLKGKGYRDPDDPAVLEVLKRGK